ncbi:MAG: hypothetical protein LIO71_08880 [Ruminococcus sp.]|nr:hypothetical protein [Ruminococcus sp.]
MKNFLNFEILLEYHHCFDDERLSPIEYLKGLPKNLVLKCCSMFLVQKGLGVVDYIEKYIEVLSPKLADELLKNISERIDPHNTLNQYFIVSQKASLTLYEYAMSLLDSDEVKISNLDFTMAMLKAFLSFNTEYSQKQDNLTSQIPKDEVNRIAKLILTASFDYNDIVNYNFNQEYKVQFTKAKILFPFLEKEQPELLHLFIEKYGCDSWEEWLSMVGSFAWYYDQRQIKEGSLILVLDPNDDQYVKKRRY